MQLSDQGEALNPQRLLQKIVQPEFWVNAEISEGIRIGTRRAHGD